MKRICRDIYLSYLSYLLSVKMKDKIQRKWSMKLNFLVLERQWRHHNGAPKKKKVKSNFVYWYKMSMVVNSMLLRLMCNGYENRENKFEKKRLEMGNNPKLTTKEKKKWKVTKRKEKEISNLWLRFVHRIQLVSVGCVLHGEGFDREVIGVLRRPRTGRKEPPDNRTHQLRSYSAQILSTCSDSDDNGHDDAGKSSDDWIKCVGYLI